MRRPAGTRADRVQFVSDQELKRRREHDELATKLALAYEAELARKRKAAP